MIGRIIMIGSLFRRKPAYTNRLACLIVINNAKGAHKTVTSPLRARVGWAQARGGVNCNLPIGNRETPMCVRVCGTLRFFLSFFSFFCFSSLRSSHPAQTDVATQCKATRVQRLPATLLLLLLLFLLSPVLPPTNTSLFPLFSLHPYTPRSSRTGSIGYLVLRYAFRSCLDVG